MESETENKMLSVRTNTDIDMCTNKGDYLLCLSHYKLGIFTHLTVAHSEGAICG